MSRGPKPIPAEDRFWLKVDRVNPTGCWLWLGGKTPKGYGRFMLISPRRAGNGLSTIGAHRFAYQVTVGPIPEGLVLDHLCRNPSCVNPEHLEPVPQWVNVRRGKHGSKTHCPAGHAYDDQNTYRDRKGTRHCRQCRKLAARVRRQRQRTKRLTTAIRATARPKGATWRKQRTGERRRNGGDVVRGAVRRRGRSASPATLSTKSKQRPRKSPCGCTGGAKTPTRAPRSSRGATSWK